MDNITSKLEALKALHQLNKSMKAAMQEDINSITAQLYLRTINCITARVYASKSEYIKISTNDYYCTGNCMAADYANSPNSTWVVHYITDLCGENAFNYHQDPDINDVYDIESQDELFQEIGFINFAIISGEIAANFDLMTGQEECDGNCKQCKRFQKDVTELFDNICCLNAVGAYLSKHYFRHEESRISKDSYIETISSFLVDSSSEILGIELDSEQEIDDTEIVRGQFAILLSWGFYWLPDNFSGHISIFYNKHSHGVLEYCRAIKQKSIADAALTEEERSLATYCYDTLSNFVNPDEYGYYESVLNSPASGIYIFPDGLNGEFILLMESKPDDEEIQLSSLNHGLLQEYLAVIDVARLTFGERIEKFCKKRSSCDLK